jgi:metal-responsive CopG/Arc/MetJ family transcriptional regulator
MAEVKTAISIDESLFKEAERTAQELRVTRSALYALAMQEFLRRRAQERLTEDLNAVYDGTLDPEDAAMLRGMREQQRRMAGEDPW